jgi:hypothetical protein
MTRTAGRVGLVAAVVCATCAGLAAGATGDAEIGPTVTFPVSPNFATSRTVSCPDNQQALSGGIIQSGPAGDADIRESGPITEVGEPHSADTGERPIGWTAAVSGGTEPSTYKVFVVCARANVTLQVKNFEGAIFREHREEVGCPGTRRAVGGGALQAGNPGADYLTESGPVVDGEGFGAIKSGRVPDAWRATFAAQEGGDEFKVVAVCTKASTAKMRVAVENPARDGPADSSARCNGAQRALGGGVIHAGAPSPFNVLSATGPLDETLSAPGTTAGDVPDYWYAALDFLDETPPFKTVAICE